MNTTAHKISDDYIAVLTPRAFARDPDADPLTIEFRLVHVGGTESDGTIWYQRKDAVSSPDLTKDLNNAEAVAEGFVKWDGCTRYTADVHEDMRAGHDALLAALAATRALCLAQMPSALEDE